MKLCIIFILLFILDSCGPSIIPNYRTPEQLLSECTQVCSKLEILKCDGWQGSPGYDETYNTKDDESCIDTCTAIMSNIEIENDLTACILHNTTCLAINNCYK